MHAERLRESEINFVFCERVLYVGTAPEQKTESAKSGLNTTFKPLFYKCIFDFILARASPCPTSLLYDNLSTARFSHFIDSLKCVITAFSYSRNRNTARRRRAYTAARSQSRRRLHSSCSQGGTAPE